jgi:hypothetical protein
MDADKIGPSSTPPESPVIAALPDERESELCRRADDQLRAQGFALESLIENLNEGVYLDGRLMLYDDDPAQLERGMCALGKLRERVRKGALKLRTLDSQRDQIDFSDLSEFPRKKAEFRHQRRTLAKITERLTDQLDRDAQVLEAFRELVERMGTKLSLATLMQEAHVAIEESDVEAARQRRAYEAQERATGPQGFTEMIEARATHVLREGVWPFNQS